MLTNQLLFDGLLHDYEMLLVFVFDLHQLNDEQQEYHGRKIYVQVIIPN
jgi:hypothetical protein